MSFTQKEKEKENNEPSKNITKPITLDEYTFSKSKDKYNNKKIVAVKNAFDLRKKHFQINRDIYKRLMKNKTQGELDHFRNNSFKRFSEVKNGLNTLNIKYQTNLNLNKTFGFCDKEQIKNDINEIKHEMKKLNEELNFLKKEEQEAKNKFIANKLIIEKILKIENQENKEQENNSNTKDESQLNRNEKNDNIDNNNDNSNKKGNNDFGSLYLTQLNSNNNEITKDDSKEGNNKVEIINIINQENKNNNLRNKNKTMTSLQKKNFYERVKYIKIKNRLKVSNFSRLVTTLKRELSDYDKSIESTSKLIQTKKSTGKATLYLNMNNFIEDKNKTLEELSMKKNSLSSVINNDNKKICLLVIRTKKIVEEQIKAEKLMNLNTTLTQHYKNEIGKMKQEKEKLINELKKIEKEREGLAKIKEQKEEEKRLIDEEFKKEENFYKEKNNDDKEISDINNKEISIKKIITKNDLNINIIKNNIKSNENQIETYNTTLKLYNDYLNIKRQIKREKLGKTQETEKAQEISKSNLNKKLKSLSNELTEKNILHSRLSKELDDLKKKYKSKIQTKETDIEKHENNNEINSPNNIKIEIANKETNTEQKKEDKKDCIIF